MEINVIGVPIFYGCDKKGVESGPNKLREKELINLIKQNHHNAYDLGDLYVPVVTEDEKFGYHSKMKYLNPIIEVNTNLAHQVYASLASNCFPFVIGGDHSLGLGSISGASKYFDGDIAVVWIDAHGDINTYETTPSGNVHGMPLAAAMGIGYKDLTNVYFEGIKVKPENVYLIGQRDLDEGELSIIKEKKLNLWTSTDIKNKGIESVMSEVLNKIKASNVKNVHLSFDIDVIDPSLAPGTGTPVEQGLNLKEGEFVLTELLSSNLIKSMDFVELNTELDKTTTTITTALDLINECMKVLK